MQFGDAVISIGASFLTSVLLASLFAIVIIVTQDFLNRPKTVPNNDAPQSSGIAQNMPTFLASIGICGGFFMPWLTLGGVVGITGSTLAKLGEEGQASWVVLILAAVTAVTHIAKPVRFLNILAGIAPFGLLAYFAKKMGEKLIENLAIGAWLILGCGLVLIFAPVKSASKN